MSFFKTYTQRLWRALSISSESNQNENEVETPATVVVQNTPAQKLLACKTPPQTGDLIEISVKPTTHFVIYYDEGNVIDICSDTPGRPVRLEHLTKVAKESEVRISDNTGIKLKIESELKGLIWPLHCFGFIQDSKGMWLTEETHPEELSQEITVSPAQKRKKEWMTANDLTRYKKPLPGDLIEFNRTAYGHFAMWYFNGYVFDIQPNPECLSFADITLEHIDRVAGDSKVCISNKSGRMANTRTVSVDLAFQDLYKQVPYNVKTTNCEYYVTEWKYSQGWSDQIENLGFFKKFIMKITGLGSSITPSTSSRPVYSKSLNNPKIRNSGKSNEEVVKLAEL